MAKKPEDRYPSTGDLGRAAKAAAEDRQSTQVERSVASGDAAPGHAMPPPVVAMPAPPTGVASSPAPTAGPTAPAAPPPPPGYAPPPPPGPGGHGTPPPQYVPTAAGGTAPGAPAPGGQKNRLPLIIGGALAGVAVIALIAVLALGGGGEEKDDPGTTAADTTSTDTGADTSGSDEPTSGAPDEADIKLAVETTLGAVTTDKADVFCGGLSLRYQNQQFGGPIECEAAFKKNDLPAQFTPTEIRVDEIQQEGDDATVVLEGGEVFRLVKGTSFWEIDGLG
jgi:hypothetical protein